MASGPYFARAIPHKDVPSVYLGCFAGDRIAPEWVMERGQKKLFSSPEAAELAAARKLLERLNGAERPRQPPQKPSDPNRPIRVTRTQAGAAIVNNDSKSERDRVFARFTN